MMPMTMRASCQLMMSMKMKAVVMRVTAQVISRKPQETSSEMRFSGIM